MNGLSGEEEHRREAVSASRKSHIPGIEGTEHGVVSKERGQASTGSVLRLSP